MDEEYIIVKKSNYIEMPEIEPVEPVRVEMEPKEPVEPKESVELKELNELKEPEEITGIEMIATSSLSEEQQKLAKFMYDSVKQVVQNYISDNSINNTIKITMTLGQAIKQMENIKINGKVPTGADKKAIVIQMCRILIKEITNEPEILMIYDIIAEQTLEVMIDTSKIVNVRIQEMTVCCPNISNLFKRKV